MPDQTVSFLQSSRRLKLQHVVAIAFAFVRWGVPYGIFFLASALSDATMRRERLDGKHGFPFLVCERLSCAELGLVVR